MEFGFPRIRGTLVDQARAKQPERSVRGDTTEPKRKQFIQRTEERTMEWTSPKFEEICLNCEINSYASAEL